MVLLWCAACGDEDASTPPTLSFRFYTSSALRLPDEVVNIRVVAMDPTTREVVVSTTVNRSTSDVGLIDNIPTDRTLQFFFDGLDARDVPVVGGGTRPFRVGDRIDDTPLFVYVSRRSSTTRLTEPFSEGPGEALFPDLEDDCPARAGHTLVSLSDGRVLVIGGANINLSVLNPRSVSPCDAVLVYDINAGRYEVARDPEGVPLRLAQGRFFHTSTALSGDRILVAGGVGISGATTSVLNTAEIIVVNTDGSFSLTPDVPVMSTARAHHTAVALSDTRVLLLGGQRRWPEDMQQASYSSSSDIFDLARMAFVEGPSVRRARAQHSADIIDSELIVCGGRNHEAVLGDCETGRISDGELSSTTLALLDGEGVRPRYGHASVVLRPPGQRPFLVLAGGFSALQDFTTMEGLAAVTTRNDFRVFGTEDALVFNDAADGLLATGGRAYFDMVATPDGLGIVVVGGMGNRSVGVLETELLRVRDPTRIDGFFDAAALPAEGWLQESRVFAGVSTLINGTVLVSGGVRLGIETLDGFFDGTLLTSDLINPGPLFSL